MNRKTYRDNNGFLRYEDNCKLVVRKEYTTDCKKILSVLDKFFNKMYNELLTDIENNSVHENYKELLLGKI
jgi:hypothetical protein